MSVTANGGSKNRRYFVTAILVSVITTVFIVTFSRDHMFGRKIYFDLDKSPRKDDVIHEPISPMPKEPQQVAVSVITKERTDVSLTHEQRKRFGRRREGKKYLLIYNNVPKCGSRSLAHTIKEHFKWRRVNGVDVPKDDKQNTAVLYDALSTVDVPAYVSGHMPLVHLERDDVVYINMIRDPVDRFVSLYYFARNGDAGGVKPASGRTETKETIDEYISNGGKVEERMFYHFMEDTEENRNLSGSEALQVCKDNIERYYTLVGLTEELLTTMKLLEKLLPDVLPGLHRTYKFKTKDLRENYSTVNKVPPSNKTRHILREKLKHEYDLYSFVKSNFHRLIGKFKIFQK